MCRQCGARLCGFGTETRIGRTYGVSLGCPTDATEEELARAPITCVDGLHDRWRDAPELFNHS